MFLSNLFYTTSKHKKPNLKTKPRLFSSRNSFYPIAVWVIAVGLAFYPIYIYPLYHSEKFKEIQEKARSGIVQEDIQPGGMRVWSDPFLPKPELKEDES